MQELKLTAEKIITTEQPEIGNTELFAVYHRIFKHRQGKILPPVIVVRGELYHDQIPKTTLSIQDKDVAIDDLELVPKEQVANQLAEYASSSHRHPAFSRAITFCTRFYRCKSTGQVIPIHPTDLEYRIRVANHNKEQFQTAKLRLATLYHSGAPYLLLDGNHRTLAAALNKKQVNALELETDYNLRTIKTKAASGELFGFPHDQEQLVNLVQSFYEEARTEEPNTVYSRAQLVKEKPDFPKHYR